MRRGRGVGHLSRERDGVTLASAWCLHQLQQACGRWTQAMPALRDPTRRARSRRRQMWHLRQGGVDRTQGLPALRRAQALRPRRCTWIPPRPLRPVLQASQRCRRSLCPVRCRSPASARCRRRGRWCGSPTGCDGEGGGVGWRSGPAFDACPARDGRSVSRLRHSALARPDRLRRLPDAETDD